LGGTTGEIEEEEKNVLKGGEVCPKIEPAEKNLPLPPARIRGKK